MPKPSKTGVRGLTREPSGRWSIDLRWVDRKTGRGMRHHERLPATVGAKAAKAHARAVLNSALDGTLIQQKARKGAPERLHNALDQYLTWAETNRPRTAKSRESIVRILTAGLPDLPLDDLKPFNVERYKRARAAGEVVLLDDEGEKVNRKAVVAPATINREVAMLKHFCKLASEWSWMEPATAAAIRNMKMLKEPPGRVRYLLKDEEGRLLAALPAGVRRIVVVADMTGMRRGEIVALRRSAVDLANRAITLTRTKSNRVRRIPISDQLASILKQTMNESDAVLDAINKKRGTNEMRERARAFVFVSRKGLPYSLDSVTRTFQRAVKRAGLIDLRLHDVRHDFATKVRRHGHGLDVIANLLGHAQVTTSARYAHVEQELLRAAVAAVEAPTATEVSANEAEEQKDDPAAPPQSAEGYRS